MYNLDELLDEVRSKYYKSSIMNRPTISWSKDFSTGCLGSYSFYRNHITISRILQNDSVPREVLAHTIHHENVHQDYAEHGKDFQAKEKLFSNSKKWSNLLQTIADQAHEKIPYPSGYNDFLKGKKRIVYINLANYGYDYVTAFGSMNCKMLINACVDVDFKPSKDDDFYVFLVRADDGTLHIVGWCIEGTLLRNRKVEFKREIGGNDILYQLVTEYGKLYVLPETCCDYGIPVTELDNDIIENNICVYSVDDSSVQDDISYINSYCEGYLDLGFDKKQIDIIPDFIDTVTVDELKKIVTDDPYRKMWIYNGIYNMEPTDENLLQRAKARIDSGLFTAALSDYLLLYSHCPKSSEYCTGIIKLYCILDEFANANDIYMASKAILPRNDVQLNACLKLLSK